MARAFTGTDGEPYHELRPAFVAEAVTLTTVLAGSGSIAGQAFAGVLTDPAGEEVEDAVTVAVAVAADRTVLVTFAAQEESGEYRFSVRRTDDDGGVVVAWGVLDLSDPGEAHLR